MQQQQRQQANCGPEVFPLAKETQVMEFEDIKTRELYAAIAGVGELDSDEKLMKEAEKITELKSFYHGFKSKQLQTIKEESYAYRGVTLRQKGDSTQIAKNRTYSIIKATKERKKTLTQADFMRVFDSHSKTKEIMYEYSKNEGNHQQQKNEQSKSTNTLAPRNGKSSRKDLRSLLSTRMNQGSLETEIKEYSEKVKPYKFLKMSKTMKSVPTEKQPCNMFNFLDGLASKQEASVGCFWQKIELISKPKKAKPWI